MESRWPAILFLLGILAVLPVHGWPALTVQEEEYRYPMELTQAVVGRTFVLEEKYATAPLAPPASPIRQADAGLAPLPEEPALTEREISLTPLRFALGSAVITPEAEAKIKEELALVVQRNTPLTVIGYSCDLGNQAVNDQLALRRARVVATWLEHQGHRVVAVQGKGKTNYLTTRPAWRALNRRVEITTLPEGDK